MDRKTLYFRGTIDDMLIELDSQQVDVRNYLDGSIADIILNKKQFKIFQIENIKDLKSRILEIEKEHFIKEVLERYHSKGMKIENAVGGWKTINGEVDEEIEKILKSVIKKNKIEEQLAEKKFLDIVYDGKNYRIAPGKVGRKTKEKKEIDIHIRITQSQYDNLTEYAKKYNINTSEALRRILEYLQI